MAQLFAFPNPRLNDAQDDLTRARISFQQTCEALDARDARNWDYYERVRDRLTAAELGFMEAGGSLEHRFT